MNHKDIAALMKGIAPAISAAIASAVRPTVSRIEAVERKLSVPAADDVKALLDRIKALEARPQAVYKGVWAEGEYGHGDMVTQGGGLWHAQRSTDAKPGTDDSWKLAVKKGEAHV